MQPITERQATITGGHGAQSADLGMHRMHMTKMARYL